MSEVNATDTRLIGAPDDVWSLYQGAGGAARVGTEVELAFFDPTHPRLYFMSVAQNAALQRAALAHFPGAINQEPTAETLEITTRAVVPSDLATLLDDARTKIAGVTAEAAALGLKRSYFQELPACPPEALLREIVDVERYRAFFAPPRADMTDIAAYFAVCKSNQVSVSYRDPDHMLANVRRLYLLAPFLFLATDNSAGFVAGERVAGHAGMRYRAALGGRGGVPPFVFEAPDGAAYLRAHIDQVWHNPLFVYYDAAGRLVRVPSGSWESFSGLAERGLNTASNYFLAQSVLWPDVKIAALKDGAGAVVGHRYEARMFGVGAWQHAAATLIVAGLAFDAELAAAVDGLLADQGVDAATLPAAYAAAREHGGAFMGAAYGARPMAEFARGFAGAIEAAYAGSGLEGALAPLLEVCRTGQTDGRVNRARFPDIEATLAFQRDHDPALTADESRCAAAR